MYRQIQKLFYPQLFYPQLGAADFLLPICDGNERRAEIRPEPIPTDYAEFVHAHKDVIANHLLGGWIYSRQRELLSSSQQAEFRRVWLKQWAVNARLIDEWHELKSQASGQGLELVGLKGVALLSELYANFGERHMSDIDVLCRASDRAEVHGFLKSEGFGELAGEVKWRYNKHKATYVRGEGEQQTTVEVHFQLWPNPRAQSLEKNEPGQLTDVYSTVNFVYLCAHCAYQHNFAKLFWLHDLHLLISSGRVDLFAAYDLSCDLGLKNSFLLSVNLCRKAFGSEHDFILNEPRWHALANEKALMRPRARSWSYLLLKHLVKGATGDALSYDLFWALSRLRRPGHGRGQQESEQSASQQQNPV